MSELKTNHPGRSFLAFAGAALLTTAVLAAAQSYSSWGPSWLQAGFYWPDFASFLLPVVGFAAMVAAISRWLAPGEAGKWVRRWVWIALVLRVLSVAFWPVALRAWGYRSPEQIAGFIATDAYNASETAWQRAQADISAVSSFSVGSGDNTGGITFMGVVAYRAFSPDFPRPLLLGLMASAFTALTTLFVYLLGQAFFSEGVARVAAIVAAVYPEAVVIGSSHLQQGYLALALAIAIWGLTGLFAGRSLGAHRLFQLGPRDGLIAALVGLVLMAGFSHQFVVVGLVFLVVGAWWLSDLHSVPGRVLSIVLGVGVAAIVVLYILAQTHIIPYQFNFLLIELKFLFGGAWTEYDRMLKGAGTDLFEILLNRLPRSPALIVAGLYGLLQPVLPAVIGYRNINEAGGGIWQLLNLLRSGGWYVLLPFLVYGFVASLRTLGRRLPETLLALLFWLVAVIASYRALGDQWDNPRYRLFALAPMALLAAWAYWHWRETRSPWLMRVVVPFAVASVVMTIWYVARYWFGVQVTSVGVVVGVVALAGLTFLVMLAAEPLARLWRSRGSPRAL